MSRKTTKAYAALFEKLLSIEPQWQPETVIIDFELAAMAGIQFIFPSINIQGCWFHSSQAIWRKIGNLGNFILCIIYYNNIFQMYIYKTTILLILQE